MNDKDTPPDDRSPMAKAFDKATHVTAIALMMVVPVLPCFWLDSKLGTTPVFTLLGLAFGMAASIWQLIQMVKKL